MEFCQYFERIRARTTRVVELIPSERMEWSYQTDKFTFGDLVRHLAGAERYMFAENAMRRPSRYPGHQRELADGREAVLMYLAERHREAMSIFSELTDDDLSQKCLTPGGVAMAVWKWLRAMVEHEVHHRGQIYLMLGMVGLATPPLYGLTSEEVYERSEH
jgi:uncharacterized damage-inducible protein DinB